jgi:hypothetical protein
LVVRRDSAGESGNDRFLKNRVSAVCKLSFTMSALVFSQKVIKPGAGYWVFFMERSPPYLIHNAPLPLKNGATGAAILIQRFDSTLSVNGQLHALMLDDAYVHL